MDSLIIRWYRTPAFTSHKTKEVLSKLKKVDGTIVAVHTELCYHVEFCQKNVSNREKSMLEWILGAPLNPENLTPLSQLRGAPGKHVVIECGPRFNFSTSESTNAVSICQSLGLRNVTRLEVSKRYLIEWSVATNVTRQLEENLAAVLHDRMTECRYTDQNIPKRSFNEKLVKHEDFHDVDVMTEGRKALEKINVEMGLAFDERDLDYYTHLFTNVMKRNPTTVECFDLAQSNSEHSRHWFFKGQMIIDGQEYEESLIDMIIKTQETTNPNNVIKFSDNSSAIKGFEHDSLRPVSAGKASELRKQKANSHLIFTAETHNFPTGVAPFSGATTGTGGRIRDVEAVGRGGYCIAGTAGYSVGNLYIPGYELPWEDKTFTYPNNFAAPVDILVEASNGASDYGNKFGEPVICGFARSFGLTVGDGERREWIKPIMFSGGVGNMEANMVDKLKPECGMVIVKIGGPVYRIGVGGGAASSVEVQGDNKAELDFNAVQRGDAEMEQKLNRVVRACLELGERNPIVSIHDQGAGGNGNVLKELVEPTGGVIYANRFDLGDPTINALELWGAEYQESNALLCRKADVPLLKSICERERCPVNFVGEVTDTGRVVLTLDDTMKTLPVNLDLEHVLGKMPRKQFIMKRAPIHVDQLKLPKDLTVKQALERVLRLPAVGSKRYLTNKVDRCVTGLIAQQQCVGPLHTPLADVAVTAITHFGYEGVATAIGEQPIKGLVNNAAGARMTVAESLTNLVFAGITELKDVKCSGNWMWAAKLPGEGAALYDACVAMCKLMQQLGIAIDGGKDSLSMAARVGNKTIKAPGTLVVSTYAPCPDVRTVVTPDLKAPANNKRGVLLFVDLSNGKNRLGGSALAQCYQQLGSECPDVERPEQLVAAFEATQKLLKTGKILSGHDISDGGLLTCVLEMAMAGMCGLDINITHKESNAGNIFEILFAEELGWLLEINEDDFRHVMSTFNNYNVPVYHIGYSVGSGLTSSVTVAVNKIVCLQTTVLPLMKLWEETSYQLEYRQTMRDCVEAEYDSLNYRSGPKYNLTFNPDDDAGIVTIPKPMQTKSIRVAVLREEGTNGDREMAAAFLRVGFEVWDITMQDLISGTLTVDQFRGLIFPGGFSYADVLGSAKGWAGGILFNDTVQMQFKHFLARQDTFSLGVCNGCQLMGLIGWIGYNAVQSHADKPDILLEHNLSERFECRWSTVRIEKSRAMMLNGMDGSTFGVWIAHGEGRFTFRNDAIRKQLETDNCISLRYVDDNGQPTEQYPMNPNGSVDGLAGVCSADGRHLAMMPHPERCDQMYLWPWMPESWKHLQKSPWERMFQNAYNWCINNNNSN